MNEEIILTTKTKIISVLITLCVSVIAEYLYLYSNTLLLSQINDESVLFIPIVNLGTFPFMLLVNYSNTKILHKLLGQPLLKYSILISALAPLWGIINIPLFWIMHSLIYILNGFFK